LCKYFTIKGIFLIAVSGPAGYFHTADRTTAHEISLMADGRLEPKRLIARRFHHTDGRNKAIPKKQLSTDGTNFHR